MLIKWQVLFAFVLEISKSSWQIQIAVDSSLNYFSSGCFNPLSFKLVIWFVIFTHVDSFALTSQKASTIACIGNVNLICGHETHNSSATGIRFFLCGGIAFIFVLVFTLFHLFGSFFWSEPLIHFLECIDQCLLVISGQVVLVLHEVINEHSGHLVWYLRT